MHDVNIDEADSQQPRAMGKQLVKDICRERGQSTSNLLSSLYLHGCRFSTIQGLEDFTNLRVLHLEQNVLTSCRGLEHMASLRVLFLQQNNLASLEGLAGCTALVQLNVSNNPLGRLHSDHLPPSLQTLQAASIGLHETADLQGLAAGCPGLQVLDIQHNAGLDQCEAVLRVLCTMRALRVLYTEGCPLTRADNYRRTLVSGLPTLHYLDSSPVDDVERAGAAAWLRGGREAEQAARLACRDEQRRALRRTQVAFAVERAKRRMAKALGEDLAAQEPLLNEDTDDVVRRLVDVPDFESPTTQLSQIIADDLAPSADMQPAGMDACSDEGLTAGDRDGSTVPVQAGVRGPDRVSTREWWADMLALLPSTQNTATSATVAPAPQPPASAAAPVPVNNTVAGEQQPGPCSAAPCATGAQDGMQHRTAGQEQGAGVGDIHGLRDAISTDAGSPLDHSQVALDLSSPRTSGVLSPIRVSWSGVTPSVALASHSDSGAEPPAVSTSRSGSGAEPPAVRTSRGGGAEQLMPPGPSRPVAGVLLSLQHSSMQWVATLRQLLQEQLYPGSCHSASQNDDNDTCCPSDESSGLFTATAAAGTTLDTVSETLDTGGSTLDNQGGAPQAHSPEAGQPPCSLLPSSTAECAVCTDTLRPGQLAVSLPCHHTFHANCVKRWILVGLLRGTVDLAHPVVTCPLCRTPMTLPPWCPAVPSARPVSGLTNPRQGGGQQVTMQRDAATVTLTGTAAAAQQPGRSELPTAVRGAEAAHVAKEQTPLSQEQGPPMQAGQVVAEPTLAVRPPSGRARTTTAGLFQQMLALTGHAPALPGASSNSYSHQGQLAGTAGHAPSNWPEEVAPRHGPHQKQQQQQQQDDEGDAPSPPAAASRDRDPMYLAIQAMHRKCVGTRSANVNLGHWHRLKSERAERRQRQQPPAAADDGRGTADRRDQHHTHPAGGNAIAGLSRSSAETADGEESTPVDQAICAPPLPTATMSSQPGGSSTCS